MGRGTSPLRSLVRGSPRKPSQENIDANVVSSGDLTPTRKPLSSIAEGGRVPLMSSDENIVDVLTPSGKMDATTPKAKKRSGQCLFPLMENVDGGNGTPEKQGHGKFKKSHIRHPSPAKSQSVTRALDSSSTEPGIEMPLSETSHAAVPLCSKGQAELHGVTKHCAENGNSHTPRAYRNVTDRGNKHGSDCEPISSRPVPSQNTSATPAKSVTRTLKYGGAQGSAVAGTSTSRALVPLPSGGRSVSQTTAEQHFDLEEDPTFWHDHNVQVLIRTRPISASEMASQGFSKCLRQEGPHQITWLGQPETRFTFDHVAGEIITQEKLFNVAGLPMVENCMAGYNSCMFAYGQTGSGKTHTMLGDIDHISDRPSDNRGMTPRVFEYLFSRIKLEEEQRKDENLKFMTKCSFLEIYNEQITDLLEPTSTNLQMREDVRKGVYVENLTEVEVHCVQDVIQLLCQGSANRKVAATNMNRESSRSHSVFTCIIESRWERDSMTNIRFGRLNLVDLAGSERQKTSGAEGERLKEAANINKSLSTLGLVIMILVDVANGKQRHVPYRDSKLTFLLQDSLGGNSKTTIIATISPSSCNALETLSTLKFAQRAKLIRNTAVINEDASGDVKALRAQIQQMKEELDRLRRQSISRVPLSQDDFNPVRSSFDSWGDAHRFFGSPQVSSRKLRQMEAVVAGALRREQAADVTTKRLAAEIEQLNRLVHQREADTQSSKMILRFREDKIRRLETLSQGLLSVDSYLAEEGKMLMEELQLMREKVDRNPELTRFAMENIRLLDQFHSLQEFHEGGEKEIMLEEISNLRDQLLEVLDGKIAVDQGLVPLTTPQKKALAPELAATVRENELLRIEADNYRSEVEELRSNLSSSLESYSKMGRQVDELQELVEKLKSELASKTDSAEVPNMKALELENLKHLELIADMKLQLEQTEEKTKMQESTLERLEHQLQDSMQESRNLKSELEAMKEAFEAARVLTKKLQSKEAALVGAQYAAAVKQIRLETEEMAVQQSQSLTNIQEMAVMFRMKEIELRSQLDDAMMMIQKLSVNEEQRKSCGVSVQNDSSNALNSVRTEDGSAERLQKAQEIEMRHAEEVMQLQLELESLEAVLDEERTHKKDLEERLATLDEESSHRPELEEKIAKLTQQLQESEEMVSSLKAAAAVREITSFDTVSRPRELPDQERSLVEALETQHIYTIQEFDVLQSEYTKVVSRLKRREERERILRKKIDRLENELTKVQEIRELEHEYAELEERSEAAEEKRLILEQKLENAKKELGIAHAENLKLKVEECDRDLTRCQAESETAQTITSMQEELWVLRAEAEQTNMELASARKSVTGLTAQLDSMRMMLSDVKGEKQLVMENYESMLKVKDIEIEALRKEWQGATVKLIDYLAEGDQALNEASFEMEQIFNDYLPPSARSSRDSMTHSRNIEKKKAVDQLKLQLQHAQELAKDAEGRVRVLSETAFAMATAQAQETPQKVHRLSMQAVEAMEVLQGELDSSRSKLLQFEKNAMVMSVLILWLVKSMEAKDLSGRIARTELKEMELVIKDKEMLLLQLRQAQELDQSLLRESEGKVAQLSNTLEQSEKLVDVRDKTVSSLEGEMSRLQSALEAVASEKEQLMLLATKAENEASDSSSAMNILEEELKVTLAKLKEAEDKLGEATTAQASLAVIKEEWETEKMILQSAFTSLEKEKLNLEADISSIRLKLVESQDRSDKLSSELVERIAEIAALREDYEKISCMSISNEEKLGSHEVELEQLKSELQQKEALMKQAESEHLESLRALEATNQERVLQIADLAEQREALSSLSVKKEEELCESKKEILNLQAELHTKQVLLQEIESKLLHTVEASDTLIKEKDENIASLKQETERMSCMSIQKKDDEVVELERKLKTLQDENEAKERSLAGVEKQLSESVKTSKSLSEEKEKEIVELNERVNKLSTTSDENNAELARLRQELDTLQTQLKTTESSLEESRISVTQSDKASEKLAEEKEAMRIELESQALVLQEAHTRIIQLDAALEQLSAEKQTLQTDLVTMESLLQESQARVELADAALQKLAEEKDVLQSRIDTMTQDAHVAASRLCEAEEAQSAMKEKIAVIEERIVEYEVKEQSLIMEIEELYTSRSMSDEDVLQLQSEVLELKRERDSLNLNVSTKNMQSAISERLQLVQATCIETDDRITSMQAEIDGLSSAKQDLEAEVQSIEVKVADLLLQLTDREENLEIARKDLERVQFDLMNASQVNSALTIESRTFCEELAAANSRIQTDEENIAKMTETIDHLNKSKADMEAEFRLLQIRLEEAGANRLQVQEKLDALTVVMHEFSVSEQSLRNERDRLATDLEIIKANLEQEQARCLAVLEEKEALHASLLVVVGERDDALTVPSKTRSEKVDSITRAVKDVSSDADEVELAKARAALAGAEEKIKLLVDANATITNEWEGERSRLNADKELLQLEISRLENPAQTALDQDSSIIGNPEAGKDHYVDELKQLLNRTSADCEKLRSKLRDRDNTILSVKLQLEEAMVHYKETEIEMEKTIREKEDAITRISELEEEIHDAQEEVVMRRNQVEAFELELETLVARVTDSESQWRAERDQLERERDHDQAVAYEVEGEFTDQLNCVSDVALAESEANTCIGKISNQTNCSSPVKSSEPEPQEEVQSMNLSIESIAAFALVKEEVDFTKNHCENEMGSLALDMESLRADISNSFFEFPVVQTQEEVKSVIESCRAEIACLNRKVEELEGLLAQNTYETDLENTRTELEMSEAAVSQLLAAVSERDASLSTLESKLKETQDRLVQLDMELDVNQREAQAAKLALSNVDQLRSHVDILQRQVTQKEELIKGLEFDINLLEESGTAEAEAAAKIISQLQKELDSKSGELEMLRVQTASLEAQLAAKLQTVASIEKDNIATYAIASEAAVENANMIIKLQELESELAARDALVKEEESVILSLKSELESAKSIIAEKEAVLSDARQFAQMNKTRSEETMASEEQLKSRISSLQQQVKVLEKRVEDQSQLREKVEKELRSSRLQGSSLPAQAEHAKQSLERKLKLMEAELAMAHQRREVLQSQCNEKDKQAKGPEAPMENGAIKSLTRTPSMATSMDYRNADNAARCRIEELESLAAGRLKEVYALNAKIAELESEMHDVVRELVRTNLDVQNIKLDHPQVKEIVATVRRQSIENQGPNIVQDAELEKLRNNLNELIEERDSWLEEIQRKQAEMVAARVTAEKMRFRDETLTAENDKLKTQTAGLQKRIGELEQEVKKLSGQQNLQQRIHHHAKIKDENNSLRLQVEDLSTKMRRSELMFARVKDELERYRIAAGKTPFPNIDEEQRLRSKLQEAEESKIQLAQQFITLCNAIQQAAGNANSVRQADQSAAMEALRELESRLRTAEEEVSEFKFKTRISGEKRRLSELRTLQTPVKTNPGSFSQQFFNSPLTRR
uniref:Kinesin motor domain-containing protein n=1 Tax=Physcomitrium patens TaxID=3218 RepID=A0A7I4DZD3_PHYPA